MSDKIKTGCIYQWGLAHITPIVCGLDGKLYDGEYCQNCKDKVKPRKLKRIKMNEQDNLITDTDTLIASIDNITIKEDSSERYEPIGQMALIKIAPLDDVGIRELAIEANHVRDICKARKPLTAFDLEAVTEDLNMISQMKKAFKKFYSEYIDPVRNHLDSLRASFETISNPLDEAEKITKQLLKDYKLEQEHIAAEQEEINRMRILAAQKEAALHNGEISEPVNLVEVISPTPKTIRADTGSSGMRDHWKYKVIDFAILSDEYKIPNDKLLNTLASSIKKSRVIPGLEIYNDPDVVSRAK